jgi:hypothetical protein
VLGDASEFHVRYGSLMRIDRYTNPVLGSSSFREFRLLPPILFRRRNVTHMHDTTFVLKSKLAVRSSSHA